MSAVWMKTIYITGISVLVKTKWNMRTRALERPTSVPEFLSGRIHTQPALSRQASTSNIYLNATLPEPENPPTPSQDPINWLAEVLINLQNKPQNQSFTIRPVNTTTMTFDGKSEKFELFMKTYFIQGEKCDLR